MSNVLCLALVTGQAREDLALARFKRDKSWFKQWDDYKLHKTKVMPYSFVEDDHYYATRQKTGALIKTPLNLKLREIDLTVCDVISMRKSHVKSKYILHHTVKRTTNQLGDPIHKDTISRTFAKVRKASKLEWATPAPPTFHEIRSLSERQHQNQGVNTQNLLGHKDQRTTDRHHDLRGSD